MLAMLVVATTLVAGVAAGQRYYVCTMMAMSSWSTCCPHDGPRGTSEPAVDADDDCCDAQQLPAAGPSVSPVVRDELRAPMVAIVPPVVTLGPPQVRAPRPVTHAARAGPQRDARTYRTFLSVSLT